MDRTFGFELEFINLNKNSFVQSLKQNNFPVYNSKHNNSKSSWRVVEDRSIININGFTGELVSPILYGPEGIEVVKSAVSLLKTSRAEVNASCGLHVHVSVKDFKLYQLKNLVIKYAALEPDIDKRMAYSRKFNRNAYCLSLKELLKNPNINAKFMRANTKTRLADAFNTRYLKLNLKSIQLFDTIEFRQHHATLNCDEVVNWIQYCLNFVESERIIK